ncbi:unnamed protein product [Schistocephalus solidus]|uniref:DUF4537 domain-containing protein n=1 Tax=Schistocephalus solidus TaxID=70667 RepID=A0A183SYX8_SCHSO|nr:unnamed protein product [Schistocephalus solidus]
MAVFSVRTSGSRTRPHIVRKYEMFERARLCAVWIACFLPPSSSSSHPSLRECHQHHRLWPPPPYEHSTVRTSGLPNPPELLARSCLRLTQYVPCTATTATPVGTADVPVSEVDASGCVVSRCPPAECVFVATRLPVSTEGMLPRLWLMQQRMQLVRRTAVALTCSWMRALLYILLPHWWATRLDDVLLGCAKCSLTFVETELEHQLCEATGGSAVTRSMGAGRRKSGISLTRTGKSKRKRARMSPVEPASSPVPLSPTADLQSSTASTVGILRRAELICASPSDRRPGLIYLPDGAPIARIDCWFFPQNPLAFDLLRSLNVGRPEPAKQNQPMALACEAVEEQEFCRSLTLASCTYAGQLTVGFTGCEHIDGQPGMGLIIEAMENQLDQLYKLLDNRFPAKSVAYPPTRGFNFDLSNKVSHHTGPEGRKDSSSTAHEMCVRHGPSYHTAPMTPVIDAFASQIPIEGGDIVRKITIYLVEGDGSHTPKYNFPSLNSRLRRTSFRGAAYGFQQPFDSNQQQGCTVTQNASSSSMDRKLVPILKSSSSYCSNKENEVIRPDSNSVALWRKPASRLKDDQNGDVSSVQYTITSSLFKQQQRITTPQIDGGEVSYVVSRVRNAKVGIPTDHIRSIHYPSIPCSERAYIRHSMSTVEIPGVKPKKKIANTSSASTPKTTTSPLRYERLTCGPASSINFYTRKIFHQQFPKSPTLSTAYNFC